MLAANTANSNRTLGVVLLFELRFAMFLSQMAIQRVRGLVALCAELAFVGLLVYNSYENEYE